MPKCISTNEEVSRRIVQSSVRREYTGWHSNGGKCTDSRTISITRGMTTTLTWSSSVAAKWGPIITQTFSVSRAVAESSSETHGVTIQIKHGHKGRIRYTVASGVMETTKTIVEKYNRGPDRRIIKVERFPFTLHFGDSFHEDEKL